MDDVPHTSRRRLAALSAAVPTVGLPGCSGVLEAAEDGSDEDGREEIDSFTVFVEADGHFWRGDLHYFEENALVRVPISGGDAFVVTVPDDLEEPESVEEVLTPVRARIDVSSVAQAEGALEVTLAVEGEIVGEESTTEAESITVGYPESE